MQENEFYIPANYLDSGYILNGRFAKRNAVEAVILGALGFLIVQLMGIPFSIDNISIYIFACCPLALIGASGVHGDPLSEFIMNAYKWMRKRKPYFYNYHINAYRSSCGIGFFNKLNHILLSSLASVKSPCTTAITGRQYT